MSQEKDTSRSSQEKHVEIVRGEAEEEINSRKRNRSYDDSNRPNDYPMQNPTMPSLSYNPTNPCNSLFLTLGSSNATLTNPHVLNSNVFHQPPSHITSGFPLHMEPPQKLSSIGMSIQPHKPFSLNPTRSLDRDDMFSRLLAPPLQTIQSSSSSPAIDPHLNAFVSNSNKPTLMPTNQKQMRGIQMWGAQGHESSPIRSSFHHPFASSPMLDVIQSHHGIAPFMVSEAKSQRPYQRAKQLSPYEAPTLPLKGEDDRNEGEQVKLGPLLQNPLVEGGTSHSKGEPPNMANVVVMMKGRSGSPNMVSVVMEGRSIERALCLQDYDSYESFAKALKELFSVGCDKSEGANDSADKRRPGSPKYGLENAIPGYRVAYEDAEGDLLLAGDLSWRHFLQVAKRIRILATSTKP